MDRTLCALVQECFFSDVVTNVEPTWAPLLLVNGFIDQVEAYKKGDTDGQLKRCLHRPFISCMTTFTGSSAALTKSATLAVLLVHIQEILPRLHSFLIGSRSQTTHRVFDDNRPLDRALKWYVQALEKDVNIKAAFLECESRLTTLTEVHKRLAQKGRNAVSSRGE